MTHQRIELIDSELREINESFFLMAKNGEDIERLPRKSFTDSKDYLEYLLERDLTELTVFLMTIQRSCIEDTLMVNGLDPYKAVKRLSEKLFKSALKCERYERIEDKKYE